MADGEFNEETVKEIVHYEDGSFDIITDKQIYKECKYSGRVKRIKGGGKDETKRIIEKN